MSDLKGQFKNTGYKYVERIDRTFASLLVDVAYIEEMNDDFVIAIPDETDNKKKEYLLWVKKTIEYTLEKHSQEIVKVELI